MFKLSNSQIWFIGLVLEGFLYGFYSGIFAMYLQYQVSQKDSDKKQNIIFYAICALYISCVGVFFTDIALSIYYKPLRKSMESVLRIFLIQTTSFGCSDFISQVILIYRCWIVWGCNIRAVIVPSILAFAFLVTWLVGSNSVHLSSDGFQLAGPEWGYLMYLSGLALSLTVNALVTGLIVFRIFKVFRQVGAISDDRILCGTGGSKLRRTILVLTESGMALFSIQLARLVVTFVKTDTANNVFYHIIIPIHHIFNGITPTIILVRNSMGLSFHDEKSMEEVVIGSLCFASNHRDSVTETRSIFIDGRESGDDHVSIQRSNAIDIIER